MKKQKGRRRMCEKVDRYEKGEMCKKLIES